MSAQPAQAHLKRQAQYENFPIVEAVPAWHDVVTFMTP